MPNLLKNFLDQLYILNSFDKNRIKIFPYAYRELNRLKSISFNQNPSPWFKNDSKSLKICMLNCAGLRAHIKDIRSDPCLNKADVLNFVETSLDKTSTTDDLQIDGYFSHFLKVSRGKGIATFVRGNSLAVEKNFVENGVQISKYTSKDLILVVVYRSQNGNIGTLLEILSELFVEMKSILIVGDFNICNRKKPDNAVKETLLKEGFQLLIKESTQIMGGHIDHAYWRNFGDSFANPCFERYSPYFSDHDALCVTMKRE